MSWLFSRALVEEYSAASCLDGEPCAQLRLMPTAHPFLHRDKTTDYSTFSQFGVTCEPLTESRGEELLTWFLEGSLARILAAPAQGRESAESEAGFGVSLLESLAKFDPDSRSLKTPQTLLFEASTECLLTLPRWGWMRNGECFQHAPLVYHTCDAGCSFWPTPRADGRDNCGGSNARRKAQSNGTYIGRYPNPILQERLMAWPASWTGLEPLGTDRFQQWLSSHGKHSAAGDA